MGTYQILSALIKHWQHPVNPVYQADMRYGPPWSAFHLEQWTARLIRLAIVSMIVILAVTALRALTNEATVASLYMILLPAACLSGGTVALIVLAVLTFFWPIGVAVAASGTIVREREHRTWAALLTTPLDWNDLLTAKLASSLRWLNRPVEMLIWIQGILLAVVFVLVIGQVEKVAQTASPVLALVITVVAGVQFAIARMQDYATASIIGLASSMQSETRQSASITAVLGGLSMVMLRTLFTAALLPYIQLTSPQALLLMLSTGPTTAMAMAFPTMPVLTLTLLIVTPVVREILLRAGYRWVFTRLGTAAGNG